MRPYTRWSARVQVAVFIQWPLPIHGLSDMIIAAKRPPASLGHTNHSCGIRADVAFFRGPLDVDANFWPR
jgi:hypothetical protein